jgi:DNA-binding CsgD family transcriptional regulator
MVALTQRERQVAELVAQGKQNKEIVHELRIGVNTVKWHLSNIMRKFNVQNRTSVARVILLGALACLLLAQTPPGTVTVVTTVTITSAAGTAPSNLACNFTGNATTAQVTINCTGASATLNSTLPLPLPAPGSIGSFGLSGNTISWSFVPWTSANPGGACPAGSVSGTCWQVVANGTAKNGVF